MSLSNSSIDTAGAVLKEAPSNLAKAAEVFMACPVSGISTIRTRSTFQQCVTSFRAIPTMLLYKSHGLGAAAST